ncbi:coiled-coil domain-containing protein 81 [Panthera tigris]|nr:coiled-coil domain-containing protein 81 [Panthera tigris]
MKKEKRPVKDSAPNQMNTNILDTIVPSLRDQSKPVLRTLRTLRSLSQEEVSAIWGNVSEFVQQQLSLQKGVQIPGLGTFTFTRQKIDVGNNKFILIQRPIFIMAEKLVRIHELKQNKTYIPGDIPVIPLNFVTISLQGPFSRDTVESCVKETLLFLSRSISIKPSVEFTFKGIGILMIKGGKVKMRFYKDFLCKMDGTGALAEALTNRPGTVDSVLSSRESSEKQSKCGCAFPRIEIKKLDKKPPMETIVEEDENEMNGQEECKLKDHPSKEGVREIITHKKLREKHALSPFKVTNISFPNMVEQNVSGGKSVNRESLSSPHYLKDYNKMKHKISPATGCQDHTKAGQELCYVCLQRALRNLPRHHSSERKRWERENEQHIRQHQMMKDQEELQKHQMRNLDNRVQNQKNAAYNLGVAEAIRIHKKEKPEFCKSFLFDKRPLSSEINAFKQKEYSQSLLKQMDNRREKQIKQRQNRELMDRLEQKHLTEELAAQRDKYIRDKMEDAQCYKRALDAQIKNKSMYMSTFEPESCEPIFAKDESEMMVQKRKRDQKYMKHQMEMAASQQRRTILQHLVGQKQDLQMLQRTQKEHLADRKAEMERVKRMNQSLLKDWERSAAMKKQRDMEEKAFQRSSNKLFILDQCERYLRCKQCQRSTNNKGRSNVWPLNKYLPGSQFFS